MGRKNFSMDIKVVNMLSRPEKIFKQVTEIYIFLNSTVIIYDQLRHLSGSLQNDLFGDLRRKKIILKNVKQ